MGATWVPEFTVENMPLDRTATLVPAFPVKGLGQNTLNMMNKILPNEVAPWKARNSFGREVNPWVPCRRLTARKSTSSRN